MNNQTQEPIAVIGMGCRFPGGANNPGNFWKILKEGIDAIVDIPADRWSLSRFYHPNPDQPGKMYITQAGFLQQPIHDFDRAFFGISVREAEQLDPQQKLLLEVTWEAMEDAGLTPEDYLGSNTGVFIGAFTMDNLGELSQAYNRPQISLHTAVSSTMTMLSNRISYAFDLRGPSLTVDTACSSSLVALHLACQALWKGECSMAMSGGVNIIFRPELVIAMCKAHFLSPEARCKTFDAGANGYARGEGAGLIILKPLSAALSNGDRIYALIRATGVNQDGRTDGIAVPNGASQEQLIRAVCKQAGITPAHIQYVEAHGTGTQIGDITETHALGQVLSEYRDPDNPCWIGSVKTNIGHLEAAAGIAGVIKSILCLQYRAIPPHLHLKKVNPKIDLAGLRLRTAQGLEAWPDDSSAYAAVNSFGYGGTNAHVILQEGPSIKPRVAFSQLIDAAVVAEVARPQLVLLSANDQNALTAKTQQHCQFLQDEPEISLPDYAYTLTRKRSHMSHRLAVVADRPAELITKIKAFLACQPEASVITGVAHQEHKLAFVYTGMGAQWWGMGQELTKQEPVFRSAIEACDAKFKCYSGWSLLDLFADNNGRPMTEPRHAQPANFALQVGLTKLWAAYGLKPDAVIGHSIGEISAAYIAGVLDLDQALHLIWHRSRLQQSVLHQGGMLAVGNSLEELQPLLAEYADRVTIAATNSIRSVTLSGDIEILHEIAAKLEMQDIFVSWLKVDVAYHSQHMEPLKDTFMDTLAKMTIRPAQLPIYSTVTGRQAEDGEQTPDYWWRNCRDLVQFQAAMERLVANGYDTFVEIGPHPVLATAIQETLHTQNTEGLVVASLRRHESEIEHNLKTLGQLYVWGQEIDWSHLYPTGQIITLPTYPWQRTRLWAESQASVMDRLDIPQHPLLQFKLPMPEPTWEGELNDYLLPYLKDHLVDGSTIIPGACAVEAMLALAVQTESPTVLEDIQLVQMLVLDNMPLLRIRLDRANGECTIHSRPFDRDDPWALHARARLLSAVLPPRLSSLPLDDIRRRCSEIIDRVQLYRLLEAHGLQYGPSFQGVQVVYRGRQEMLALIDYSEIDQAEHYWLHPVILDAGFQACFAMADNSHHTYSPYIPVGIKQVRLHTRPSNHIWCYGRITANEGITVAADLIFCDEDGQVVVEVFGAQFQTQLKDSYLSQTSSIEHLLYQLTWEASTENSPSVPIKTGQGRWLIFGDNSGIAEKLAAHLNEREVDCVILPPQDFLVLNSSPSNEVEQLQGLIIKHSCDQPITALVYLRTVDLALQESLVDDDVQTGIRDGLALLSLIQTVNALNISHLDRFVLVTCGAQCVIPNEQSQAPGQMIIWGIGRVLANEHPRLNTTLIDLDPTEPFNTLDRLTELLLSKQSEVQICLRGQKQYYQRLEQAEYQEPGLQIASPETACVLDIGKPGLLDSLEFREVERRKPGPGEIEVQIRASALNFKDVLKAATILPTSYLKDTFSGDKLGSEHSGVVVEVGPDVKQYRPGDAVVAIERQGGFRTYSTLSTQFVVPKPDNVSFEESVVLINFMTAYYALHHVGRLSKGEHVLIHSATGGVGLAAIQVARWLGAEIFATAGTPEKRDFLRQQGIRHISDSRTLKFVDDILNWTNGEGVDVVLNSLSGEAFNQGLKMLAPFGRFLELGKRDILENNALRLAAFNRNLTFSTIDFDLLAVRRPKLLAQLIQELYELFQQGVFNPLPMTIYRAVEVEEAFRYMLQAKHIGKIVIDMYRQEIPIRSLAHTGDIIKPDRSYLITGGYSGLGLVTAKWLVQAGARHLVLVSRRGPVSAESKEALQSFVEQGVQVIAAKADISKRTDVAKMIYEIEKQTPPLAGIFHSAMVLDDAPLIELNWERFEKVLAPKVLGAWYLHELTQHFSLDLFVLFSSVAAIIGNPLQGNYVAANAFLNGLAHYRRSRGLAGLSINWGSISQVGVVARNPKIEQHLYRLGIQGLNPDQVVNLLTYFVKEQPVQICGLNINWRRWLSNTNMGADSALYTNLIRKSVHQGGGESADTLYTKLHSFESEHRLKVVAEFLLEQIAKVTRIPKSHLNLEMRLNQLGLDSLMALELSNLIRLETYQEISPMILMQAPSIHQLANLLLEKIIED